MFTQRQRALEAQIGSCVVKRGQRLTIRELEVALLVADGLTNVEVGEELTITRHTVKLVVERIFTKAGVTNRVQLANWLRRNY